MKKPKLVSACLFGIGCRYDGEDNLVEKVMEIAEDSVLIPVCPEQLGGLSTPRPPMRVYGGGGSAVLEGSGKIVDSNGEDVSDNMIRGAEEVLKIAEAYDVEKAILKARSPSCGSGEIHGEESVLVEADGVTATLLKKNGIDVVSEEDL